jgi:5'-nucleotidase (lipoprotein e(P4) family)
MNMSRRLLLFLTTCAAAWCQAAHENLNAVLWIQTSAERRASKVQTYRAAERQLLAALNDLNWTAALEQFGEYQKLPPAVILDLDETVLDNSAMQARLIAQKKTFDNAEWTKWVEERRAALVPGAIDFLKVAHANGVAIFYVTNRVCDPAKPDDPTVELLRRLSVPFSQHRLFCRTDTSDKSPRRSRIAAAFRVLLLIGDDFNDFLTIPPLQANVAGRLALVEAHDRYWGERWFVIPNPMYGSWEQVVGLDLQKKHGALKP